MTSNEAVTEAALGWLVRTNDPEFAEWEAFTAWLEQEPVHADTYHRLASSERLLTPHVPDPAVEQDNEPVPAAMPRGRWVTAASVAFAGVLAVLLGLQTFSAETYATGMGERRIIALGGGDEIILNGGTEIKVSDWSRRNIRLERGQALFRMAGNEGVEVRSGDLDIVDIGTVFEVTRSGDRSRVVVEEGAVMVDPAEARLTLAPGQQLQARDGAMRLAVTAAVPGAAGAWTRGQLVFVDAPLAEVAADLSRSTGLAFSASSASSARRFSGTLSLADVRSDPGMLEPLLGVPVQPVGNGWRFGEVR